MKHLFILLSLIISLEIYAQETDNLAQTPPMGWNSWNLFEGDVSEDLLKGIADAMAENGMLEAGYEYIIIDDIWQGGRDNRNRIIPDPQKFPNGIKALADYIHSKGLKLGIYSTAAKWTCAGYTASEGFEELDAKTFAEWEIDYLKYDYCNAPGDMQSAMRLYKKMGDELKKTGRPIVYAICEWGQRKPWLWGKEVGGHLWRTTWDSRDYWESENYTNGQAGIMNILDKQEGLEKFAGPGSWNDPDLLMVGLWGKGKSSSHGGKSGCTFEEYKSHFSLWCILAAPLIVNMDVRNMDKQSAEILLNQEVIDIDQDPLGKQGFKIKDDGDLEIFYKELAGDEIAICILNRSEEAVKLNIDWKELDINNSFLIRDLWQKKHIGNTNKSFKAKLNSHGVILLRLLNE
ncbi:glycoside hydrolase family 27 protein [Bacteroidota bacterium]